MPLPGSSTNTTSADDVNCSLCLGVFTVSYVPRRINVIGITSPIYIYKKLLALFKYWWHAEEIPALICDYLGTCLNYVHVARSLSYHWFGIFFAAFNSLT